MQKYLVLITLVLVVVSTINFFSGTDV